MSITLIISSSARKDNETKNLTIQLNRIILSYFKS